MADAQYGIALVGQDLTGPAWNSFIASTRAANKAVADLKAPIDKLASAAEAARKVVGAIFASEVVARLIEFNSQIRAGASAMASQADALGINTDQLQAYQAASRMAGLGTETMVSMIGSFNVAIGKAAAGDKAVLDVLNKLGVKIIDVNGNIRDNTSILTEASSAILNEASATTRAADAKVLFGKAGALATPILREFAQGMDTLNQRAMSTGQVLDGTTIASLQRMQDQSEILDKQIKVLWATVATPIELKALQALKDLMASVLADVRETNAEFAKTQAASAVGAAGDKIAALQADLGRQEALLNHPARQGADNTVILGRIAGLKERIASATNEQAAAVDNLAAAEQKRASVNKASDGTLDALMNDGLPAKNGGARNPPATSSGEARDRIGEEIAKLQGEQAAAEKALAALIKAAADPKPLADIERAVELQRKTDDIIAGTVKYNKADPRIQQVKDLVASNEAARSATDKFMATLKFADETEAKYDTTGKALRETELKIKEAVDSRRLTQEAGNLAMQEASRIAEDLRLKNIGLQGGAEAFIAGWEDAQNKFTRANNAFATGGKVFDGIMSTMDSALNEFVQNGQVNFEKLLASFVLMIAQMELRAAASSVWGAMGGSSAIGGLLSSLFSAGVSAGTGAGGVADGSYGGGMSYGGPRASGGPVDDGVTHLVGENGPELFTPRTAGTIIPNGKFGGGGDSVTVHQTMYFGSDVTQATLRTWAAQVQRQTEASIIAKRKRGDASVKAAFG